MSSTSVKRFCWIFMVLGLLSGCGSRLELSPEEAAAVAKIEALGGSTSTEELDGKLTVAKVDFRRIPVKDEDLVVLAELPNVHTLHLARTEVGDAALAHVAKLSKLHELYLGRTAVTDKGLDQLKGLTELEWISIRNTKVTADGIRRLQKKLPQLKEVR